LETNCTLPSAASSDCAAKPNETKLKTFPPANSAMPACHSRKERAGRGLSWSWNFADDEFFAPAPPPPPPSELGGGREGPDGEAGAFSRTNASRASDLLWPSFMRFCGERGGGGEVVGREKREKEKGREKRERV
jgi:hypothetical protein